MSCEGDNKLEKMKDIKQMETKNMHKGEGIAEYSTDLNTREDDKSKEGNVADGKREASNEDRPEGHKEGKQAKMKKFGRPLPELKDGERPRKKFYRSRAHVNPLSHNDIYEYPRTPKDMDWSKYFPQIENPRVTMADVGCGFGGLTVALSSLFPDKLSVGMEIRPKVVEFVRLRIENLRKDNPGQYNNVSVVRSNTMKHLVHFFEKGQLEKMFFCFPDPHFKAKKFRRRIVSEALLDEYAYVMKEGGLLYTVTDVEELYKWHLEKGRNHPFFEQIAESELENDDAAKAVLTVTEEGKKVARNEGKKFLAVFRRKRADEVVDKPMW